MNEYQFRHQMNAPEDCSGASLSKIDFSPEIQNKLLSWHTLGKNILILSGTVGVGKTYYCWAYHHDSGNIVRHYEENDFIADVRGVMNKGWDYQKEIQRLCDVKAFIIDDIGTAQLTDFQKEVMESFINFRWKSCLPTIISSNLTLEQIGKKYGERVQSRLEDSRNTYLRIVDNDRRKTRK